jgi:hypothetical protein
MLWSIKSLSGYTILATDGEIGKIEEFLFEDELWLISYLVVNTGDWLRDRKVLISPVAIHQPDWSSHQFPVELTKDQVKNSPTLDVDRPIPRQQQIKLHNYYKWPYYWTINYPISPLPEPEGKFNPTQEEEDETHLRNTKEVIGYHLRATDGDIGHIEDVIVEDDLWGICYMVIDTRNWLPGRKVLIPPTWIKEIRWTEKRVSVDLSREKVKESPEYNPSDPVNREYEIRFYDYYGRPKYWQDRKKRKGV